MKITAIYDNGGETLDRYTFVLEQAYPYTGKIHECLSTDYDGVGFSQFTVCEYNKNKSNAFLGKRVHFEDLSADLQAHVAGRLWG